MAKRALCLNMIVKNEAAIIERSLRSVADSIDCWVICDTGSTDGTQDIIRNFFAARGIPGELHHTSFQNFEQARNEALDLARASKLDFDYIILNDADMEVVVTDKDFASKLTEQAYVALQRSTASYWNVRMVRRDVDARYKGVTHEHLDVPDNKVAALDGIFYIDHASGSNRHNKYDRDISLLLGGLEQEPDNKRYMFYLGQCYCGSGQWDKAIETYDKRIAMGGWDEEVWFAKLQRARCLLVKGEFEEFVRGMLTTYSDRPHRVEPLHDLAKYYRHSRQFAEAVSCAESALCVTYPPKNDTLFVEDWVYDLGVRLEFVLSAALAGDIRQREKAQGLCEWLALTRHGRDAIADQAQDAGGLFAVEAASMLPSLQLSQIGTPPGIVPKTPSAIVVGDTVFMTIQSPGQQSTLPDPLGLGESLPAPSESFLLQLDLGFNVQAALPIGCAEDHPGLEDLRLLAWKGDLWALSTARHLSETGVPQAVLSRLALEDGQVRATDWTILAPEQRDRDNLIPQIDGDKLRFFVGLDPVRILDHESGEITTQPCPVTLRRVNGTTPMVAFDDGWLCIAREYSQNGCYHYSHRFLWFDAENKLRKIGRRFYFKEILNEIAGGLAWHPDGRQLILSVDIGGQSAWLAQLDAEDVRDALVSVDKLAPPGVKLVWAAGSLDGSTFQQSVPVNGPGATPVSKLGAIHNAAVRSFDLFDTLAARRCVQPAGIFDQVEQKSGHAGFAQKRVAAERELLASQYTLDLIYQRLVDKYEVSQDQAAALKALEIETELGNLFPIAQHCQEVGKNDIIVSDMYLPQKVLEDVVHRVCKLPGRRVVVTSGGKHFGTIWPTIQAVQPIREHLGDNPHSDNVSPRKAGIPARITNAHQRMEIETQLADAGHVALSNLMREARLTTWLADPGLRRAQLAQIEINFPMLFLTTIHMLRLAAERGWDHFLLSGRDCWLWAQLYEKLRPQMPQMPTANYFYTSRAVRLVPSQDYVAYFNHLRAGQKNAVVDLCGTGVSIKQLCAFAPGPETEIYLMHELVVPGYQGQYDQQASQARQTSGTKELLDKVRIESHSVFCRPPVNADNDVLEDLNRAPHASVDDVRVTPDGFEPVFSHFEFKGETEQLFRVHQAAFRHATNLVPTLPPDTLARMMESDPTDLIVSIYNRLPGLVPDLMPFFRHKMVEDNLLVNTLRSAELAKQKEDAAD